MAIQSFANRVVEKFFREGKVSKGLGWATISKINDQWRAVFRWSDAGPEDVDIRDYH